MDDIMSFQAYLNNIFAKTGKTPEDFKKLALTDGILNPEIKAGELVEWLKAEHQLGHGHAMAIWNVFVTNGWVQAKNSKLKKNS